MSQEGKVIKNNMLYNYQKQAVEFLHKNNGKGILWLDPGLGKTLTALAFCKEIGAEKIWHLVQYQLKENAPKIALNNVKELLITYTREIQALNIGLIHNQEIYSLNYYTKHSVYYKLQHYENNIMKITCSEKLEGLDL